MKKLIWVLKQTVVNQKSSIEHQASIKVYKCRNNFSYKETKIKSWGCVGDNLGNAQTYGPTHPPHRFGEI